MERSEEVLRERGRPWLADFLRVLRLGARSLARRPLFAITVFILALGIGATTAIFTLVDAIVLSPLPFSGPGLSGRSRALAAPILAT